MLDVQELPLIAVGLPESTVGFWFIREGEPLTPGPLIWLQTRTCAYMLVMTDATPPLQGAHLQRILSDEGARVTGDSPLALLRFGTARTRSEQVTSARSWHREAGTNQQALVTVDLELGVQRCSLVHAMLARRSARYRRLFRRYYPLFTLARPALALCLMLGTLGLMRGLEIAASALLGEDLSSQTLFSLLSAAGPWVILAGLCCFTLLLILSINQVLSLRKHRLRWQRSTLHNREQKIAAEHSTESGSFGR